MGSIPGQGLKSCMSWGVVKKIFLMKCSRSCNCISMFDARLKYTCQGFAGALKPSIFREWPVLNN